MIERILRWIGGMLSDNGSPSSSRVMMLLQSFFSCYWITLIVLHSKTLPDATTLAGVAAFIGAPYAINRFSQK